MLNRSDLALEHAVQGKIIYLLALIALVQFGYPATAYGALALIAYELLYASMIVVGVLLGRDSRFHTVFLSLTGAMYLLASLMYALNRDAVWAVFITYLALIPYRACCFGFWGVSSPLPKPSPATCCTRLWRCTC